MKLITAALIAALSGAGGWTAPAAAADWSATSAWGLHGSDFELGEADRDIVRIEHADGWAYGDNYFFFDMVMPESADSGTGTSVYGEVVPRFSLGKLSGRNLGVGPVKDWLLTVALNSGTDFRAYLYGASVDLNVPGFTYFQFNAYVRDDKSLPGTTRQITPVWLYPFALGKLKFELQGFVDWAGAEGPAAENLLIVPRLWLDLGALWGAPGRVQAGAEYLYWKNKFGIEGVTERVFQPSLRWTF